MHLDEVTARIARAPDRTALLLDFDGTLADIVDDPASASLPGPTLDVLGRLAGGLAVVAVISGRPAAFLAAQVPAAGVRLLGLYGLEESRDGRTTVRSEARRWQPEVDRARDRLTAALNGADGVHVEDKGLAVAVHWRNAADRDAGAARVQAAVAEVAAQTGLACEPGKLVADLRPPVDWDKGASVRALQREVGARVVVYAGDDRGDLAAFAAAHDLGGLALLAANDEETPRALRDAADAAVDGPPSLCRWLVALADVLRL